jgi:hypothetical protein
MRRRILFVLAAVSIASASCAGAPVCLLELPWNSRFFSVFEKTLHFILERTVIKDAADRYGSRYQTVELFLESQEELLTVDYLLSGGWIEHLHEQGNIKGAVLLYRSQTAKVGESFTPVLAGSRKYYADDDGNLHYQFSLPEELIFMDALLNEALLEQRFTETGHVSILYDSRSRTSIFLQDDSAALAALWSDLNVGDLAEAPEPVFIGPGRIAFSQELYQDGLHLVSVLKVKPGFHSIYFIGLIALLAAAILVIVQLVRMGTAGTAAAAAHVARGRKNMPSDDKNEQENKSVLDEIDREISDIFPTDTRGETESGSPAGAGVSTESGSAAESGVRDGAPESGGSTDEEEPEDDRLKQLRRDGIIIKK